VRSARYSVRQNLYRPVNFTQPMTCGQHKVDLRSAILRILMEYGANTLPEKGPVKRPRVDRPWQLEWLHRKVAAHRYQVRQPQPEPGYAFGLLARTR
jgi:hypothetical protein